MLRLVQTTPLPGVKGRLDHMGVDVEQKRLFLATVDNHTLEVIDLTAGRALKSLTGFKEHSGRAISRRQLQQTIRVQPRWACQDFSRRDLQSDSGLHD